LGDFRILVPWWSEGWINRNPGTKGNIKNLVYQRSMSVKVETSSSFSSGPVLGKTPTPLTSVDVQFLGHSSSLHALSLEVRFDMTAEQLRSQIASVLPDDVKRYVYIRICGPNLR
jgi:hypothetical protein